MSDIEVISEVVVIGAGIIGLSTALQLHLKGHKVTLVDGDKPMQGCSAGNAGFLSQANIFPPATSDIILKLPKLLFSKEGPLLIAPGYLPKMIPWTIKAAATLNKQRFQDIVNAFSSLITRSQSSLHSLASQAGAQDYLSTEGGLVCFLTRESLEAKKKNIPQWQAQGIDVEVFNRSQTRELEPGITENIVGSLFFKNSGRCNNPQGLGLRYFAWLTQQGVTFVEEKVLDVNQTDNGGWRITTTNSSLNASKVIFCAGFYSASLLKKFGYKALVASERGYHLMLANAGISLTRPVVFGEPYFAATPMEHGLRLAGTAEFCQPNRTPSMSRAFMLRDLAKRYLPALRAEHAEPWMGIRPTMPDGLPAIGAVKDQPGLYYAYGHGHNGLMTSAITAECITALVDNKTPPVDITPFALERFA
ncbi:NAD(P)/FAD-dependent oxidoreductase [Winslowiella iniecta]|uniref:FAD dependent oxidoreductase domain-containing protein n=1 Tax=Winslowiella iniecta TaxID=1560201 RepID=A0A0L7T4K5_9GAMM|nr:FAD-dependent oxidoreductase [Winslowiella iniecta]KOC90288.1 hypothetical protein NG42_09465 [Winslowiella iniecta]KOC94750.1 hypothetical protein NG43_02875 [Winslowiella iniecta]